jgi:hypothetical protein
MSLDYCATIHAIFFPSGSIEKYQIKSSPGYYTQHREVTGAGQEEQVSAGESAGLWDTTREKEDG